MPPVLDNIQQSFNRKYTFSPPDQWLKLCLDWLKSEYQFATLTNDYCLERIYEQWLHSDLNLIQGMKSLPDTCLQDDQKILLSGKYPLQINKVLCISDSYYTQLLDIQGKDQENARVNADAVGDTQWKPPPAKRMLWFELTDGVIRINGMEYETIQNLDRNIKPGTKILVSGPVTCRRGGIFLTNKNTKILGGYVEQLLITNSNTQSSLDRLTVSQIQPVSSSTRSIVQTTNHNPSSFDDDDIDDDVLLAIANSTDFSSSGQNHTTSTIPYTLETNRTTTMVHTATAVSSLNNHSFEMPDARQTTVTVPSQVLNEEMYMDYSSFLDNDDDFFPQQQRQIVTEAKVANIIEITEDDSNEQIAPKRRRRIVSDEACSPPSLQTTTTNSISIRTTTTIKPAYKYPYTYLSLIEKELRSSITVEMDYQVKAYVSTLLDNPTIKNGDWFFKACINDGSQCQIVQLHPNIINEKLGLNGREFTLKRKELKTKPQQENEFKLIYNQKLKDFTKWLSNCYAILTLRFQQGNDEQTPIVMKIDSI
ncbi:unnamed protein product [Didymodactylos carnosus]|uniref:RecQ-mediated genome instability protein 1 n=1 Tax=Didymodactylos carnosus TaxID=1234261 RepID=A0A814H7X5_9BILA|nr:unnamed protein product [Didymodactylos carnosus]CAF1005943.1 unnamed protein product [Didymodactylos carnosus]CAF3561050.1 unnamed protein product [Didymodactylos carnosus]CAF3777240.1 unnamed protein product [Didymodactylos carnosus]